MNGKKITIFFVILAYFCTLLPIIPSLHTPTSPFTASYTKEVFQSTTYPSITNSDVLSSILKEEDMLLAYDHGLKSGYQYYHIYHLINVLAHVLYAQKFDKRLDEEVTRQKHIIDHYCPEYLEELRGLACATHIRVERLLKLQLYLGSLLGGECTITASTGPATKHNNTYLTQNWDMPQSILEFSIWRTFFVQRYYIHEQPSHYRYMFLGVPVLYEHPLLNENGLGWGGTGTPVTTNTSRTIDEGEGMPIYLLVRKTMMSCATVQQVRDLWTTTPRSSYKIEILPQDWDFDSYVFCDREGGILMIEQTHRYLATVFGTSTELTGSREGILWHTNHHLWLDPLKTGTKIPGEDYKSYASLIRSERTRELLETSWGNITLEACMNLTRDHGGGTDSTKADSADICRHPDDTDDTATVLSWIVEPQTLSVYMTKGYPCSTPFEQYDFSGILE